MICQSHEEALLWVMLRADLGEQSIVCRSNGSRESGSRSLALAIRVNDSAWSIIAKRHADYLCCHIILLSFFFDDNKQN